MATDSSGKPLILDDKRDNFSIVDKAVERMPKTDGVKTTTFTDMDIKQNYTDPKLVERLTLEDKKTVGRFLILAFLGLLNEPLLIEDLLYLAVMNITAPKTSSDSPTFYYFSFCLGKDGATKVGCPNQGLSDLLKSPLGNTFPEDTIDWKRLKTPIKITGLKTNDYQTSTFSTNVVDDHNQQRSGWNNAWKLLSSITDPNSKLYEMSIDNLFSYLALLGLMILQGHWRNSVQVHNCLANITRVNLAKLYQLMDISSTGLLVSAAWVQSSCSLLHDSSVRAQYCLSAVHFVCVLAFHEISVTYNKRKREIQKIFYPSYIVRAIGHGQAIAKNLYMIQKISRIPVGQTLYVLAVDLNQAPILVMMTVIDHCSKPIKTKDLFGELAWFGEECYDKTDLDLTTEVESSIGFLLARAYHSDTMGFFRPEYSPLTYVATCKIMIKLNANSSIVESAGYQKFGDLCDRFGSALAVSWFNICYAGTDIVPSTLPSDKYTHLGEKIKEEAKKALKMFDQDKEAFNRIQFPKATSNKPKITRIGQQDIDDEEMIGVDDEGLTAVKSIARYRLKAAESKESLSDSVSVISQGRKRIRIDDNVENLVKTTPSGTRYVDTDTESINDDNDNPNLDDVFE
jgi:hypothetical protein